MENSIKTINVYVYVKKKQQHLIMLGYTKYDSFRICTCNPI